MNNLFLKLIQFFNYWRVKEKGGLYEEHDPATFGAKVLRGSVVKSDLTDEEFSVLNPTLIHQLDSDFCVGGSRNYGAQATEKDTEPAYSYAFAFAVSKFWGDINAFGTSILAMCKGAVEYGICVRSLWNYQKNKRNYYANPQNIPPEAYNNAAKHKAGSYFKIEGQSGWDNFDLFRAYLNKFRDKKCVIHTGVDAHAITLIGQKKINGELKLYGPDSYGEDSIGYRVGKSVNGFRYFNRWEADQLMGAYILVDMPRDLAELLASYDGKAIKVDKKADCYLVKGGEKHLLKSEPIAWSHNTLLFDPDFVSVLSQEDFDKIPVGEPANFKSGKNWQIVQRILEKTNNLKLLED